MQIFGFLGSLLGYILWGAFYILKDFGLSIIVFTVIVKLILFPFSVKQQKSMAGTARLSKKQKELQEKYANNRQKLQEETNTDTCFMMRKRRTGFDESDCCSSWDFV